MIVRGFHAVFEFFTHGCSILDRTELQKGNAMQNKRPTDAGHSRQTETRAETAKTEAIAGFTTDDNTLGIEGGNSHV